jgi:hypothetical protein
MRSGVLELTHAKDDNRRSATDTTEKFSAGRVLPVHKLNVCFPRAGTSRGNEVGRGFLMQSLLRTVAPARTRATWHDVSTSGDRLGGPRMDGSVPVRGNRKIGSTLSDTITTLRSFTHRISKLSGGVVGYQRSVETFGIPRIMWDPG